MADFNNEKFQEARRIAIEMDKLPIGPERDKAVDAWLKKRREGFRLDRMEKQRKRILAERAQRQETIPVSVSNLARSFKTASDGATPKPSILKRPPVADRKTHDLNGTAMVAYISNVQKRLTSHLERHAPNWHSRETRKILMRWNAPRADHPAPNWAATMPRDVVRDARNYAASLLKERLEARKSRLESIRLIRNLDGEKPLRVIFHEAISHSYKHKI